MNKILPLANMTTRPLPDAAVRALFQAHRTHLEVITALRCSTWFGRPLRGYELTRAEAHDHYARKVEGVLSDAGCNVDRMMQARVDAWRTKTQGGTPPRV